MHHRAVLLPQTTLAAFALVLSLASAPAQRQFAELPMLHVPKTDGEVIGVAAGDLDGDGDVDLVRSVRLAAAIEVRLHLNADGGVFGAGRLILGAAGNPYLVDVDGDRDLDLLVTGNPATLLSNDGAANFSSPVALPSGWVAVIAAGDVDRDGDVDLIVGSSAPAPFTRSTRLWLNDGAGNFTDVSTFRMPTSDAELNTAIVLADLDRDGDLDIVVGNTPYGVNHQIVPGPKRLYLNDGAGSFSDASSRLPADPLERTFGLAAGDLDFDGDLDLVLGSSGPQSRLFLNDGTGTFTDGTAGRMPAGSDGVSSLALTDVDFDRDLDLVLMGARGRLFLNDGRGTFTDVTAARMPGGLADSFAVSVADVDGDVDGDLIIVWPAQVRLLLNSGRGEFGDATRQPMPVEARGRPLVFGDVDRDGDLDLVAGGRYQDSGPGLVLFVNDGFGRFAAAAPGRMPADADPVSASLTLADVDGDGDLDALFVGGVHSTFPKLYRNDGAGTFTDVTAAQMPRTSASLLVAGDVDGDGDADVVVGRRQGGNDVLVNDGRGSFALVAGRFPAESNWPAALALGDVDRDGDLDLFLGPSDYATFQNRTKLYLNDGAGRFTDFTQALMPPVDNLTSALAVGDVDRDGDLDLVLGNWGTSSYPNERHRLYLNGGSGRFTDGTAGRMPAVIGGTYDARLVDVDDDGALDLLVGQYGAGDRLWLNDGSGRFSDAPGRLAAPKPNQSFAYATGDVDGDGDHDVFTSELGLLQNLHRQSHAPLLARTGRSLLVDFWSRPGYGGAPHFALPLVAPTGARTVVPPFGVLGLSPAALLLLPLVVIPPATGKGTLALVVPNDPSLVGGNLFFQGLVLTSAELLDARFTNVTSERVY